MQIKNTIIYYDIKIHRCTEILVIIYNNNDNIMIYSSSVSQRGFAFMMIKSRFAMFFDTTFS